MKKPETTFAEKVDRDLKSFFGPDIDIENIQQVAKVGSADRFICCNGLSIRLELKTDEGKPSKAQLLKLARHRKAGGYSEIVTPSNWSYVFEDIKSIFGY